MVLELGDSDQEAELPPEERDQARAVRTQVSRRTRSHYKHQCCGSDVFQCVKRAISSITPQYDEVPKHARKISLCASCRALIDNIIQMGADRKKPIKYVHLWESKTLTEHLNDTEFRYNMESAIKDLKLYELKISQARLFFSGTNPPPEQRDAFGEIELLAYFPLADRRCPHCHQENARPNSHHRCIPRSVGKNMQMAVKDRRREMRITDTSIDAQCDTVSISENSNAVTSGTVGLDSALRRSFALGKKKTKCNKEKTKNNEQQTSREDPNQHEAPNPAFEEELMDTGGTNVKQHQGPEHAIPVNIYLITRSSGSNCPDLINRALSLDHLYTLCTQHILGKVKHPESDEMLEVASFSKQWKYFKFGSVHSSIIESKACPKKYPNLFRPFESLAEDIIHTQEETNPCIHVLAMTTPESLSGSPYYLLQFLCALGLNGINFRNLYFYCTTLNLPNLSDITHDVICAADVFVALNMKYRRRFIYDPPLYPRWAYFVDCLKELFWDRQHRKKNIPGRNLMMRSINTFIRVLTIIFNIEHLGYVPTKYKEVYGDDPNEKSNSTNVGYVPAEHKEVHGDDPNEKSNRNKRKQENTKVEQEGNKRQKPSNNTAKKAFSWSDRPQLACTKLPVPSEGTLRKFSYEFTYAAYTPIFDLEVLNNVITNTVSTNRSIFQSTYTTIVNHIALSGGSEEKIDKYFKDIYAKRLKRLFDALQAPYAVPAMLYENKQNLHLEVKFGETTWLHCLQCVIGHDIGSGSQVWWAMLIDAVMSKRTINTTILTCGLLTKNEIDRTNELQFDHILRKLSATPLDISNIVEINPDVFDTMLCCLGDVYSGFVIINTQPTWNLIKLWLTDAKGTCGIVCFNNTSYITFWLDSKGEFLLYVPDRGLLLDPTFQTEFFSHLDIQPYHLFILRLPPLGSLDHATTIYGALHIVEELVVASLRRLCLDEIDQWKKTTDTSWYQFLYLPSLSPGVYGIFFIFVNAHNISLGQQPSTRKAATPVTLPTNGYEQIITAFTSVTNVSNDIDWEIYNNFMTIMWNAIHDDAFAPATNLYPNEANLYLEVQFNNCCWLHTIQCIVGADLGHGVGTIMAKLLAPCLLKTKSQNQAVNETSPELIAGEAFNVFNNYAIRQNSVTVDDNWIECMLSTDLEYDPFASGISYQIMDTILCTMNPSEPDEEIIYLGYCPVETVKVGEMQQHVLSVVTCETINEIMNSIGGSTSILHYTSFLHGQRHCHYVALWKNSEGNMCFYDPMHGYSMDNWNKHLLWNAVEADMFVFKLPPLGTEEHKEKIQKALLNMKHYICNCLETLGAGNWMNNSAIDKFLNVKLAKRSRRSQSTHSSTTTESTNIPADIRCLNTFIWKPLTCSHDTIAAIYIWIFKFYMSAETKDALCRESHPLHDILTNCCNNESVDRQTLQDDFYKWSFQITPGDIQSLQDCQKKEHTVVFTVEDHLQDLINPKTWFEVTMLSSTECKCKHVMEEPCSSPMISYQLLASSGIEEHVASRKCPECKEKTTRQKYMYMANSPDILFVHFHSQQPLPETIAQHIDTYVYSNVSSIRKAATYQLVAIAYVIEGGTNHFVACTFHNDNAYYYDGMQKGGKFQSTSESRESLLLFKKKNRRVVLLVYALTSVTNV